MNQQYIEQLLRARPDYVAVLPVYLYWSVAANFVVAATGLYLVFVRPKMEREMKPINKSMDERATEAGAWFFTLILLALAMAAYWLTAAR